MAERAIVQNAVHPLEIGYSSVFKIDFRPLYALRELAGVLVQVVKIVLGEESANILSLGQDHIR